MEWLSSIRKAIEIMENGLREDISVQDIADEVFISPFFLQKGFSIMTGFGMGEYLRSRRLYEAALDLKRTNDKIIDIALRYAYDTPESFTKAFTRFHGASPTQVRSGQAPFKTFLPLKITITIQGGNIMEHRIENKQSFKVIGFQKEISYEDAYAEVPKFWDEINEKYFDRMSAGGSPADACEKAIIENRIGEYGVCIDDLGCRKFRYIIAGKYEGGEMPEGMTVYEFPAGDWAVFDCKGAMPEALQSVNTRVFKEWLPGNPDYEISGNANIEWYESEGDPSSADYRSAIWLPVKKIG